MPFHTLKYDNADELQEKINEYFEVTTEKKEPYTIAGLAYQLGFASRQSLYDYEKYNDERSYSIKRAILLIESQHEHGLSKQSNSGHIFWLKNRGWTDKQVFETDNRHSFNKDPLKDIRDVLGLDEANEETKDSV